MSRRVDPKSAAHTDDETEMGHPGTDVKPEPHPWPLQAAGLQRSSPEEVPTPGRLQGAPRSSSIRVPAPSRSLLAQILQNQSPPPPPWTSLVPDPHNRQPRTDRYPDILTCGLCQQTFPLEAITAFVDHKKQGCQPLRGGPSRGSDSELGNLKTLTCVRCGRQFTDAWKLLRHAQWDHGLSIYQTEPEAPETPLLRGLAEGSRAHSLPRQSPTCPVCLKTLSSFNSLRMHMRLHSGERPSACDQ